MSGIIAKTEGGKSTIEFVQEQHDQNEAAFKVWFWDNGDDLWDSYVEYVDNERDSWEHKKLMLTKEACFKEWCEEIFYSKTRD